MTAENLIKMANTFLAQGNLKKTREHLLRSLDKNPTLKDLKKILKTSNTLIAFEILERKRLKKQNAKNEERKKYPEENPCEQTQELNRMLNKGFL
jgi:pantothenate kinase